MNFGPIAKFVVIITIFSITLSLALNLTWQQFLDLLKAPKKLILGTMAQTVLLPIMTFGLVSLIQPDYKYALAMFFIAACPGGNTSNYISYLAGGSVPYSMSLTFFSSTLSIFATPFNMIFWASIYPPTAQILKDIEVSRLNIILSLFILLILPLIIGVTLNQKYQGKLDRLKKHLGTISLLAMICLFGYTLSLNTNFFDDNFSEVFFLVLKHNTAALLLGLITAIIAKVNFRERRTLVIEVGYQNTALALAVALKFFADKPEIPFLIAWWSVWHNISAIFLIGFWRGRDYFKGEKKFITLSENS